MDDRLRAALETVTERQSGRNIIDAKRVDSAAIMSNSATIVITPPVAGKADLDILKPQIEDVVSAIEGIEKVRVIMTQHKESGKAAPKAPKKHSHAPSKPLTKPAKRVIVVASGKGGVGKSTVAANLAAALAKDGMSVGFLDADIYGPSGPRLFGLVDIPGVKKTEAGIQPLEAHGVKVISIGFMVKPGAPVVWRGPMVQGAIRQLMMDTDWGNLDVLIIDMPPGTGDAQLAIAQDLPVDGAVIVSTPQDLALDDARKAIGLFQQTHVPILGIIENMSLFLCPHCGEGSHIFGYGGARAEAKLIGTNFLGEIPLDMNLRSASDAGRPSALDDGPIGKAFLAAAKATLQAADINAKPAPEIVFQ
jgi:ATP-binding protein involved in chromosome partitioning